MQLLTVWLFSRRVVVASVLAFTTFSLGFTVPLTAQDADVAKAIREHLDAGEFGLAADLVATANTPRQRDALMRPIVAKQAAVGMFQESLETASSLSGDQERTAVLDSLKRTPIGNSGSRGGAALADFDSLIELIESTISPDSWDTVGGPGAVEAFPGGVFVDASGLLKRVEIDDTAASVLEASRARAEVAMATDDVCRASALRKVSLTRLERELQVRWAAGRAPSDAMRNLAGLQRVKYIFVYPDSRDIVIAGPAGDWTTDVEGRSISTADGSPALQLDDLIAVLRNASTSDGRFGCSITPTKDNLAGVQSYLRESSKKSLKPHQRDKWLAELQSRLGRQDIVVFGIDARTHAARVLVEADYRMKLVGMGLEAGTRGVTSYLDSIEIPKGESPPETSVLRWWFTMNYDAIRSTESADAFSLHGDGVKVLSENELLTARGERVHTGKSEVLNAQFAQSFTKHFGDLAKKYPVYAELRNIFDLALVAAVLHSQELPERIDWEMPHLLDAERYHVRLAAAPRTVETVMNHRIIDRKHIVVGVSGGVSVDTHKLLQATPIRRDGNGQLAGTRRGATRKDASDTWWWD